MSGTQLQYVEPKICPIRGHHPACVRAECAWWDGKECVVLQIGMSLKSLDVHFEIEDIRRRTEI